MQIDPDELFEAAGYPTVRTLRRMYQDFESTIDASLLSYLAGLSREKQRRLLSLLEGMQKLLLAEAAVGGAWQSQRETPPFGNIQAAVELTKVGS
jgi:hypothetical protein